MHCHSGNASPHGGAHVPYGARTPGDPRKGGSPEKWLGKTICFISGLGLDMKRIIATQYVSHTARAHPVTHEKVGRQSTGLENKLFHFHSGPQHEATHCYTICFSYGARTPGDPRSGGSPEYWFGKTDCSTCILGLNIKRRIATQYVSHTARAHQVTHEGVGHQ